MVPPDNVVSVPRHKPIIRSEQPTQGDGLLQYGCKRLKNSWKESAAAQLSIAADAEQKGVLGCEKDCSCVCERNE